MGFFVLFFLFNTEGFCGKGELPRISVSVHAVMLCNKRGIYQSGTWWFPVAVCPGEDHEATCLRKSWPPHLGRDSRSRYPARRIFESKNRNKDEEIPEQLTSCAIFKLFLIIVLPQIII